MSEQPLVSIIVPVYNASKYLRRCIESILSQSYRNIELLLIDDGSTDNSGEICNEYASLDNRILTFHMSNGGVSSARNYGLLVHRGKYLTFIDSDDYIDTNHIESLVSQSTYFDWIMTGMRYVNNQMKTNKLCGIPKSIQSTNFQEIDSICEKLPLFLFVTNKLYKSSIIKEQNLSFIEKSHIHEDRIFNLNYLQFIHSFIMLPEITYNHVDDISNSLSHSRAHPNMSLITAKQFDKIIQNNILGKHMSIYAGKFCIRFYLHAIGLCLTYPQHKLTYRQRISIFWQTLKCMLSSCTIKKYKGNAIKWIINTLYFYAKKI